MKARLASFVLLLLVVVCTTACLGPKPVLKDYTATPPAPSSGEPFRVEAVVSNASSGAGQVEVDVSLTNKQTGEVIDQESKDIQMEPNQTQRVLFEINLPPSAKDLDPQSIVVDVEAHYPVE